MNRTFRATAALLACGGAFAGGAAPASAANLDIVIAGDSYSSGNGAGGYTDTSCYRSKNVWGQRYASSLRAQGFTTTVKNVACSGGVVKDLDAQINAVTPETDLVALTIGGNDIGFTKIVVNCFAPVAADPVRCRDSITKGKAGVLAVRAGALQRLDALKAKLRPGAKVIVLSYPYLANTSNYILRGFFTAYNAGKAVRELGDLGDQAIIDATNDANSAAGYELVKFIPTKDLFVGHEPHQDPYKENSASWIWEFTGWFAPLDIYHPKPAGQAAMSLAVQRAAGSATPDFGLAQ